MTENNNYFECIKCKYQTHRRINMKKHLDKLIKCPKTIDIICYTDEEIQKLSLTKVCLRKIINENICNYCNKKYSSSYALKRHMDKFCKKKDENGQKEENIQKEENEQSNNLNIDKINNIDQINNITNNTNNTTNTNSHNTNNIQNNININIINLPIGFDKDWTTEHIDKYLKGIIVLSDNKYTSLLCKILDNKENLNVIVDKEINEGKVYSNSEYKNVEKKEIADISMQKLNQELIRILGELASSENYFSEKTIEEHQNLINKKYNEYVQNSNMQKRVQDHIINIYDSTKNVAKEHLMEYMRQKKEGY